MPPVPSAGMDQSVEVAVQQHVAAGVAPPLRKHIPLAGWLRYIQFVKTMNHPTLPLNLPTLPIAAEKATLFAAFLGPQWLAVPTIEGYLSAIHHMTLTQDPSILAPSFHTPLMALLLEGIKCTQAKQGAKHIH